MTESVFHVGELLYYKTAYELLVRVKVIERPKTSFQRGGPGQDAGRVVWVEVTGRNGGGAYPYGFVFGANQNWLRRRKR